MDLIHKKKENRAQIFQSFDSLKGFKEMIQECEVEIVSPRILSQDDYEILDERVHQIQKGMMVSIEYYDRISEVRRTGNYEQWVKFFLDAVNEAAVDSLDAIEKLTTLHKKNVERLPKSNRNKDNLRKVFDYIEQYPIIEIKRTAQALDVSYNTVSVAVKKLVELGVLAETTNAARNRVFAYEEYLEILRKDT